MSSAELAVAREGVEHAVDVLDRVVRVRGEAEVAGARRGDDAVAVERLDERGRIGGGDAEERAAGRAEQVLEHAGGEEVDVELPYVEGQRADRLVGVEEDEGAALVREARDRRDVEPRAVAVADMGDRDEQRVVVDRALEVLERDRAVAGLRDVDDARAPRLLRVPDLADGRELPVGEHDLRAARVAEAGGERADSGREGG